MAHDLKLPGKLLALCCAILCCVPQAHSVTRYSTIHNNFASLRFDDSNENVVCEYKDAYLHIDNANFSNVNVFDTTRLSASDFRYQVRLANRHNNPRSTYTVRDKEGKKHQIKSPEWGLILMDKTRKTQVVIAVHCDNSNVNDDLTDHRMMHITVTRGTLNGHCDTIAQCAIDQDVDLYTGFNTLQAEVKNGTLSLGIGSQRLNQLTSMTVSEVGTCSNVACFVGAGACVDIERAVITCDEETPRPIITRWTRETLNSHFETSIDPVEGYWQYLDRDMEDKWLKIGGRYTIAVVANSDGYDLIYLDGAQTRKSQWNEGMLKGRIMKTAFSDNYDLMWIDATFEPITLDAYATIENGVLLTLHFPVYKSQMRLAKVLPEP